MFKHSVIENFNNLEFPSRQYMFEFWRFQIGFTLHRHAYSHKRVQRYVVQLNFVWDAHFDGEK